MKDVIAWITENWESILAAWGGLVAAATVIVKLTPTDKDNKVLDWIVGLFDWFSVVNPKGTKVTKE